MLRDLDRRRLTTEAAGQLLGLERRQVFRLLKAYRTAGPAGLISQRRGRRSNRRKPAALRRAGHPLQRAKENKLSEARGSAAQRRGEREPDDRHQKNIFDAEPAGEPCSDGGGQLWVNLRRSDTATALLVYLQ